MVTVGQQGAGEFGGGIIGVGHDGQGASQQAYLKASNTGAGDEFTGYSGRGLAVSGDTIVIGSNHEGSDGIGVNGDQSNDNALDSGAAYIFVRSGTNWSQQAYLKASNAEAGDEFGDRVDVSGDLLVVATGGESSNATGVNGNQSDNSAPIAGAAYVFVRSGTNWTQQAYLKASNTEAFDEFGSMIALSGDTLVVAAVSESSSATGVNGNQSDNSAPQAGAAYVFTGLGPSAPQLAIEQSAGNVRIFWPLSVADFVLDEADDLNASPMIGWTQVPFPYQTITLEVVHLLNRKPY